MHQTWYTMFLLQWIILNQVQPKATDTTPHHTALTILYLTDSPLTKNTEESFETFLRRVSNGTNAKSDIKLQSVILPNHSASLLPTLKALNSSLPWEDMRVVILDVDEDKVKAISLLSCFGLLFDIRTRPTGENDKTFPSTLTVKPSLTRLQEAVEKIFGEIGWTTMSEIECYSREERDIEKMKRQLKTIKESKFRFIFVKCLDNLDLVLKHGKTIGLTGSEYRWVFPGILSLENIRAHLPTNVIGVDLPGSLTRYDLTAATEEDLFLKDVLSVLEKILIENSQKLCHDWSPKTLTSFLRRCVNKRKFSGYTGDVIFNAEGERSGEIYEIFELITLNGKHRWLPIGSLEGDNVNILFNQWRLENNHRAQKVQSLRVVTIFQPPWLSYTSEQPSPTKGSCVIGRVCRRYTNVTQSERSGKEYRDYCCTGIAIELLERLETDVGFLGEVHLVKDGAFGSNDPKTHQWNGMVGELVRNEADLAVSSLTITAKRSKVVDFTYPYVEAANGILVSTESASHTVWEFAFLDTFSMPLWVALFLAVQVVLVVLWLAEKIRQRRRFVKDPFKRDDSMSYSDIINYTWSLLFQKASEEIGPRTLGGRTVAAFFAFATIIACSSFTANLAAIKVSERSGISISGIHDSKFQNGNSDFKFGTIAHSANLDFLRDSNDEALQRIFRRIRKNVVSMGKHGADKVAKGEWAAYIDDVPQLEYLVSKQTDCKLKVIGDPFFFSGYGIGLQKNSTWNARLSLAITKIVRDGFIQELESKWMPSTCGDSSTPSIDKMGVNDIGGAFLIVAFGCIICVFLLGVEYAIWRAMAGRARSINEERPGENVNQTLSMLSKVFTLWDANDSAESAAPAEASLRNFKTFTQQRHLGDLGSQSNNAKNLR